MAGVSKQYKYYHILPLLLVLIVNLFSMQRDIKFRRLSIEDGLSQNSGNCIVQDNKGFVWIGTETGLNRYDGYSFSIFTYDKENQNSISNSFILALFKDSQGMLWVGTEKGLNCFDPSTGIFTRFVHCTTKKKCLSNDRVLSICEDNEGNIWVGTGFGLNRYDKKSKTFTSYYNYPADPNSLSHNIVQSLYVDRNGILWIGTYGGGLNAYDKNKDRFYRYNHDSNNHRSISSNKIMAICEDMSEKLWIGTEGGGLNLFDPRSGTSVRYNHDSRRSNSISDNNIKQLLVDISGMLWIGTNDGGVNVYDRERDSFIRFMHDPNKISSLSHNRIEALYEDKHGGIWLGTRGGGVNLYNRDAQRFLHYRKLPYTNNSLSYNAVRPIYEDKRGIVWVGTDGGGLNAFNREKEKFTHFLHHPRNPNSISDNRVFAICEDGQGYLWIGTHGGGLNRFHRSSGKFVRFKHSSKNPKSLGDNRIRAIVYDTTGVLWIGTNGGGLDKYDMRSRTFSHFRHDPTKPQTISNDRIYCLFQDRAGILWVGTFGGGLNRFDPATETFTHYRANPSNSNSISKDFILSIYEDTQGVLWVGTVSGGLNRFDRERNIFTHLTTKDGLPDDLIYDIIEDHSGHLWMSTNRGLSRFNPKTKSIKNYDVKDGLQSNEFNTGTAFRNRKGEIYFGGVNGFNIFHPDNIQDNQHIPEIVVTGFEIFNTPVPMGVMSDGRTILEKPLPATKNIKLSYKDNVFSFEFAALHYVYPMRNQYAYIMEGLEKKWNYVKNRRWATYTTLPPGKYVFRVKGSNSDGVWNEKGTSIAIRIIPPFWQTWWFYMILLLIVMAIGAALYRYQIERLKRQKEEDERKKVTATFSQALEQGSTAVYRRNYVTNSYEYIGEGIKDITGFAADEITPDIWERHIISIENKGELAELPPEEAFHRMKSGQVNRWLSDTKIRTKSGAVKWVLDLSTVLRNSEGNSFGCLGILFDITDRKNAEQQLEKTTLELSIKNQEMEADLNMAREVQMAFLNKLPSQFPEEVPEDKSSLRYLHRYIPATTLGGDFFDILPISDSKAGVLICDVMGHGARASLLTAYLQGLIEELMPAASNPAIFVEKLNMGLYAIMSQFNTGIFATVFYLVVDLKKKKMYYTNAGHPGPFIMRRSEGIIEKVYGQDRRSEPALGLLKSFKYTVFEAPLSENDIVLLYTDGIYEVENGDGEVFGKERLLHTLQNRISLTCNQLLDSILDEIQSFSDTKEFKDDVCLVTMQVGKMGLNSSKN